MKTRIKKKNKGFLILIAVLVSMVMLSIGIFIATIAVREIALSNSVKDSQRAFAAADTATECALFKEFKEGGLPSSSTFSPTEHNKNNAIFCNGYYFDWYDSYNGTYKPVGDSGYNTTDFVYYISLGDLNPFDTDNDGIISKKEIEDGGIRIKNDPYVKLIIKKTQDPSKRSVIQAFGHNAYDDKVIIERALETKW